jgi:hypothetical protein
VKKLIKPVNLIFAIIIVYFVLLISPILFHLSGELIYRPLLPKLIASDCPYYKDLFGRFYYKKYRTAHAGLFVFGPPAEMQNVKHDWHRMKDVDMKNIKVLQVFPGFEVSAKNTKIQGVCLLHDGKNVIYGSYFFKEADADTFTVLTDGYFKDNRKVFYKGWHISGSDPDSFEIISVKGCFSVYAKDNDRVYYELRVLEKADPKTFEAYCENRSLKGRDGANRYRYADIVEQ